MFILTLVLFLGIDFVIQRRHARQQTPNIVMPLAPQLLKAPKGLFYTKGFTWYKMRPDGNVTIGLNELVRKMVGHIDAVETATDHSDIEAGDTLISLLQGEHRIAIKSPFAGQVTFINPALSVSPDAYLAEAYSDGWICNMTPASDSLPVKVAMIGQGAVDWMKNEIRHFTEVVHREVSSEAGLTPSMLDGGQLPEGVLSELDGNIWKAVQQEVFGQ